MDKYIQFCANYLYLIGILDNILLCANIIIARDKKCAIKIRLQWKVENINCWDYDPTFNITQILALNYPYGVHVPLNKANIIIYMHICGSK